MHRRDWSLVFFTLVTQCSVGIVICLALLGLLYGTDGLPVGNQASLNMPVLLALVVMAVATLVSTAHLGNPKNALRALSNLAGSWLSREILAIGIYSLCLLIILAMEWMYGTSHAHTVLLVVCSIAGIALLWAMARVYMIPTIPPWNTPFTPIAFATTALCLGPLALLTMDTVGVTSFPAAANNFLLGFLASMLLLVMISSYLDLSRRKTSSGGIGGPGMEATDFRRLNIVRMLLPAAALLLLVVIILKDGSPAAGLDSWIYPLGLLVVTGEIIGRIMFYASYYRTGM